MSKANLKPSLGRLRIFDAASGIERLMLDRKADSGQVVFGTGGHRLVVGGFTGQGATTIDIFDYSEAGSHVPVRAFLDLAARSGSTRFSAQTTTDGKYLVTIGDHRVLAVFEIATGTRVGATDVPIGDPVAMSPDGHLQGRGSPRAGEWPSQHGGRLQSAHDDDAAPHGHHRARRRRLRGAVP